MVAQFKANRDPTNVDVQLCRFGLDNNADIVSKIQAVQNSFVTAYISTLNGGNRRRKRSNRNN